MSDFYSIVSARQSTQVLSQTESAPVELVTIATKPSGINTVVLVPLKAYQAGDNNDYLQPPAELIEELLQGGLVTGMVQVQSSDASDLLKYYMQATVSFTPSAAPQLPLESNVLVPNSAIASLAAFNTYSASANGNDPILVAYQQLQKLAGS